MRRVLRNRDKDGQRDVDESKCERMRSAAVSRTVGFVVLAFFIVLFAVGVGFLMLRFANSFL